MARGARKHERSEGFAPRVVPAGDGAQMLELAEDLDLEANAAAHHLAAQARAAQLEGVTDAVAGLVTVTVYFAATDADEAAARRAAVTRFLLEALAHAEAAGVEEERPAVAIPVCYEPEFGPDLAAVAAATRLSVDEVVRRHTASLHRVLMLGFTPGFPYLGGLDARLAVPRRSTPRARVEAGAVAIANGQTAVYPSATPGGWNVIGRTPLRMFDPRREPVSLLQAGDRVSFVPISARDFARHAAEHAPR
jgi:inhibitor of KinA